MMPNLYFRYQKLFLCEDIIGLRLSGINLNDNIDRFVWNKKKANNFFRHNVQQ